MLKRILVGLGGTPFTTVAVKRACELAQAHGAELTAVTVMDLDRLYKVGAVPAGAGAYAWRMAEQRVTKTRELVQEAITRFKATCDDACGLYTIEKEAGNPFDLMISHARYHDLTIFGLRSLFDYGLTPEPKDVLIQLVSQGVRPILAVSTQYRPVRKALVAYSGSMESAKAMRRFIQMRMWPELQIEIVNFSTDAAKGDALLEAAAAYCQAHGFEAETRCIDQNPDEGVLAQARQSEADIIVMGNSVRSLMFRQILGSTALATVQNADRPLFLAQ